MDKDGKVTETKTTEIQKLSLHKDEVTLKDNKILSIFGLINCNEILIFYFNMKTQYCKPGWQLNFRSTESLEVHCSALIFVHMYNPVVL